ncbi:MAG: cyclic nucleotide-binding domain-containing protein [Verrucomicrobia bacterium]|nr:cyclic nucleotide-binding domain-containing protein [Verrucomicrobiota bacterium]
MPSFQHQILRRLLRAWAALTLPANLFVLWETPIRLMTGYRPEGAWSALVLTAAGILLAGALAKLFRAPRRREGWQDLVTSLPLDLLLPAGSGLPWSVLRWVRLLRVTEVVHFQDTLSHWQGRGHLPLAVGRLLRLVFWIFLADHFVAIGWMALGGTTEFMPARTSFAEPFSRYLTALYWSTATLATVGYGDITAKTDPQRLYAIFVMFSGVGLFGYVIGDIVNLVANLDQTGSEHRRRLTRLDSFMRSRGFPRLLREKVHAYYDYIREHKAGPRQESAFEALPESLRTEISLALHRRGLERVPLFQGLGEDFQREIVHLLEPRIFMPGDVIFREGDPGDALYFVSSGTLEVYSESDPSLDSIWLEEGTHFGEIALAGNSARTRSVRTTGFCELYKLGKDVFDLFLAKYPEFKAHIEETLRTRQ